jgi:hypothetical protein
MAAVSIEESLKVGRLPEGKTALFMCDLQEKFRPAMLYFSDVVSNAKKLVGLFFSLKFLLAYNYKTNVYFC